MRFAFRFAWMGLVIASALLVTIPARAASSPVVLQPSTSWTMDYADQSCRLLRVFASGDDQVLFRIERYGPGDSFLLTVAGKKLGVRSERQPVDIHFGPSGAPKRSRFVLGSVLNEMPAMFFSGMRLVHGDSDRESDDDGGEASDIETPTLDISSERETAVSWLQLTPAGRPTVRLELGSMGPPMEAMRACTKELTTHWGIAPPATGGAASPPVPASSPNRWLGVSDFPKEQARARKRALVFFRLRIDPAGKAVDCTISRLIGDKAFGEVICTKLRQRAAFKPAVDMNGNPVESVWLSSGFFTY